MRGSGARSRLGRLGRRERCDMHIVLEVASRLLGGGCLLRLLTAFLGALLGLAVGRRDVLRRVRVGG